MPRQLPPIDKRFPVNRPHAPNKGNHGPYLTPILKKLLTKKIRYEDPETQKIIKGVVKDVVMLRLILNASQGDNVAIKEILERVDGKVIDKTELSGELKFNQMPEIKLGKKSLEVDIG